MIPGGSLEIAGGADHPTTATSLNNLALVLADQDLDTARLHERALTIREARLGRDHPGHGAQPAGPCGGGGGAGRAAVTVYTV